MNVLGIAGSLRQRSFNRLLLHAAVTCAPARMKVRVHDDLAAIPSFNEDLEDATGGGPASVRELRRLVLEADGLLIATPEYNHSIPGVLKNAIDWLSRASPHSVLEGKPVAVIGASAGSWGTRLAQGALRLVLYATESPVLPAPALFVRDAASAFDASGRLVHPRTEEQLRALLAAFADWIPLVSRSPART
jgi:chromate reductase